MLQWDSSATLNNHKMSKHDYALSEKSTSETLTCQRLTDRLNLTLHGRCCDGTNTALTARCDNVLSNSQDCSIGKMCIESVHRIILRSVPVLYVSHH